MLEAALTCEWFRWELGGAPAAGGSLPTAAAVVGGTPNSPLPGGGGLYGGSPAHGPCPWAAPVARQICTCVASEQSI